MVLILILTSQCLHTHSSCVLTDTTDGCSAPPFASTRTGVAKAYCLIAVFFSSVPIRNFFASFAQVFPPDEHYGEALEYKFYEATMFLVSAKFLRLGALSLLIVATWNQTTTAAEPVEQRAALVTGASTGIGRNIAERLASEGFFVYAGARKDADIAALSSIENIQGVRLDVTIQADIDAAVETVRAGGRGLYGIVNNAGVVVMGLLAETPETEVDFVFDVNVYGPYRIVKAFAPMIVESKGRISNISSLAGIKAAPAYGVYSMSKHAIESFTDSLVFEFGTVGVQASVVEPGPYNSRAVASNCKRRKQQAYDPSGSLFPGLAAELAGLCDDDDYPDFPEPDVVADAVLHALSSANPKQRYLAVTDQRHAEGMVRDVIKNLIEINANGHSFGFSREELVTMLDEALEAENEE